MPAWDSSSGKLLLSKVGAKGPPLRSLLDRAATVQRSGAASKEDTKPEVTRAQHKLLSREEQAAPTAPGAVQLMRWVHTRHPGYPLPTGSWPGAFLGRLCKSTHRAWELGSGDRGWICVNPSEPHKDFTEPRTRRKSGPKHCAQGDTEKWLLPTPRLATVAQGFKGGCDRAQPLLAGPAQRPERATARGGTQLRGHEQG